LFYAHGNQSKFKFTLCTWQPTWVEVHIVHMAITLSSSLHPLWKGLKKKAMIQCITSKILFCYVVSNAITCLLIRNLNILDQFCIFHNLGQFILLELIAKVKINSKLCDFLQQANHRIFCDSKIYFKIFLVPHIHTIYNL
jgi:uncharacterized membrane protein